VRERPDIIFQILIKPVPPEGNTVILQGIATFMCEFQSITGGYYLPLCRWFGKCFSQN
jgi:hypothetical protein